MLAWPRSLPIEGEPVEVAEVVSRNEKWLAESDLPKLFINGERRSKAWHRAYLWKGGRSAFRRLSAIAVRLSEQQVELRQTGFLTAHKLDESLAPPG
jgi:hypothetical protein